MTELEEEVTKMLQDVATCWNSAFVLLDYGLDHWEAVDQIMQCQPKDLGLRKFELGYDKWKIAKQLRDVLKVLHSKNQIDSTNGADSSLLTRSSRTLRLSSRAQRPISQP